MVAGDMEVRKLRLQVERHEPFADRFFVRHLIDESEPDKDPVVKQADLEVRMFLVATFIVADGHPRVFRRIDGPARMFGDV